MTTRGERLKAARVAAGYKSSREAAFALGVSPATFNAHERAEQPGSRDYGPEEAKKYGRKFRVDDTWLLTGKGVGPAGRLFSDHIESGEVATQLTNPMRTVEQHAAAVEAIRQRMPANIPLVGYVGAGSEAHFYAVAHENLDLVPAPVGANENTVAVEIRGTSIGSMFDRWLVYYDDVRSPVTHDLIGRLCVVGLPDDRVLVKKIKRSTQGKHYDLLSENEDPIKDVQILWAAKVTALAPR